MNTKFDKTEEFVNGTKTVPGCSAYRVGPDGGIYSKISVGGMIKVGRTTTKWRKLTPQKNVKGYLFIRMNRDSGVRKSELLHRVILRTFVGPCAPGFDGLHNDGNKINNALTNLRWGTPEDNYADWVSHGGGVHGERNPMAKLSALDVTVIRKLRKAGHLQREIANYFSVARANISLIENGRTWVSF